MAASGNTIAVTSVLTLRSGRRLYRDSSPVLKICAAKTCDSLLKYSYSWKTPRMCRNREVGSLSSHPFRTPRPPPRAPLAPRHARRADVGLEPERVERLAYLAGEGVAVNRGEGDDPLVRIGGSGADVPVAKVADHAEAAREAFVRVRKLARHLAVHEPVESTHRIHDRAGHLAPEAREAA